MNLAHLVFVCISIQKNLLFFCNLKAQNFLNYFHLTTRRRAFYLFFYWIVLLLFMLICCFGENILISRCMHMYVCVFVLCKCVSVFICALSEKNVHFIYNLQKNKNNQQNNEICDCLF